jgi:dTDP-4-amino-4,6-dideoxygalactose transaminase
LVASPALPSRREVYRKIPSLPKFPTLSEADQEYIVRTVAALKHL